MRKNLLIFAVLSLTLTVCIVGKAEDKIVTTVTDDEKQSAEVTMEKETVFSLVLFDGRRYQWGFAPGAVNDIYMIADENNVLELRDTYVYYWPISKEYLADWRRLSESRQGNLEISQGGEVKGVIPKQIYMMYFPNGQYTVPNVLEIGDDALKRAMSYRELVNDYQAAVRDYYQEQMEFYNFIEETRKNPEAYIGHTVRPPEPPDTPVEFAMELSEGFIVNLPPGTYNIRVMDEARQEIPGSAKKLHAFKALGEGVAYDVIPEDKWTKPKRSPDLSENFYTTGNQVLYLQPSKAQLFNKHNHIKLLDVNKPNSGKGMENQLIWFNTHSLFGEGNRLELLRDGEILEVLPEREYIVKQKQGTAFGYDVLEYNPQIHSGSQPNFIGYRLEIPAKSGDYKLRLVNADGQVVEGSSRDIHLVNPLPTSRLVLTAMIPLFLGLVAKGFRKIRTSDKV